jgi:hypothetical protein
MASTTTIIYAGYGVWNSTRNCTNEAQGNIADAFNAGEATVKFVASNDAWGPDPSPGNRKYFFVAWQQNGIVSSGVVGEGDATGVTVPTGVPVETRASVTAST